MAGCNRFGIDHPCPIITKRLSSYGNSDDLEKDFKRLVEKYKSQLAPHVQLDPDIYVGGEVRQTVLTDAVRARMTYDFNETAPSSPLKKLSKIANFQISRSPSPNK